MADDLQKSGERKPERKVGLQVWGALALGGLGAAFALLNLDDVRVNWILGEWSTPLILVIGVSFALGLLFDRLVVVRGRRRHRD